jgi:hypothetical protein
LLNLPQPLGCGGFGRNGLPRIKHGSAWRFPARKRIRLSALVPVSGRQNDLQVAFGIFWAAPGDAKSNGMVAFGCDDAKFGVVPFGLDAPGRADVAAGPRTLAPSPTTRRGGDRRRRRRWERGQSRRWGKGRRQRREKGRHRPEQRSRGRAAEEGTGGREGRRRPTTAPRRRRRAPWERGSHAAWSNRAPPDIRVVVTSKPRTRILAREGSGRLSSTSRPQAAPRRPAEGEDMAAGAPNRATASAEPPPWTSSTSAHPLDLDLRRGRHAPVAGARGCHAYRRALGNQHLAAVAGRRRAAPGSSSTVSPGGVDEGAVGWVRGWGHGRERKIKEKRRERLTCGPCSR